MKKKLVLPTDRNVLEFLCRAAIERLIECEEVCLDKHGAPYWDACGEYLDGTERPDEDDE